MSFHNLTNFRQKLSWVDKYDLGNRAFNDAMTLDQVSKSKFQICITITIESHMRVFRKCSYFNHLGRATPH